MLMYKELLEKLTAGNRWAKAQPPCPEEDIQKAENGIGKQTVPGRKQLNPIKCPVNDTVSVKDH